MRIKYLCLLALIGALPLDSFAKTRMYCVNFKEAGTVTIDGQLSDFESGGGCEYTSMPLYNQKSTQLPANWMPKGNYGNSTLCGPTASAMALSAITLDDLSYYVGSWTQVNITYHYWVDRVINMAIYMGTTLTGGTGHTTDKYAARSEDIVNATSWVRHGIEGVINPSLAKDMIAQGVSPVLDYGRYTKNCLLLLDGEKVCTYKRTGGHVVAINGTYQDAFGTYFKIYNPIGPVGYSSLGTIQYSRDFEVPVDANEIGDNRPFGGFSRRMTLNAETATFAIVEAFGGIQTNE